MAKYRKLSNAELAKFGFIHPNEKFKDHIAYARKYYPPNAAKMIMHFHSEYNDETYNNQLQYIVVEDALGNELLPLKGTAEVARREWYHLPVPEDVLHEDVIYDTWRQTNEPLDKIEIPLGFEIPELYVKES